MPEEAEPSMKCFCAMKKTATLGMRATTEIAITNRRIIYKRGFIQRHTAEMNMDKVASVDVKQSILGRVFDYGTVRVQAAGMTLEDLPMIESPT